MYNPAYYSIKLS